MVLLFAWFIKSTLNSDDYQVLYLSLWIGIFFGIVLQRSRFCFYCLGRDYIEKKESRGLLGITVSLIIGTIGYHFIFGAFLIEPNFPYLPPNAHISPVSVILMLGSFCFGLGMSIAGSCISAQLYRLGEGLLSAVIAIVGVVIGYILAFQFWNLFYLKFIINAPIIWLPHYFGYSGSIIIQLLLLTLISVTLFLTHQNKNNDERLDWWRNRWPSYVGGILVGFIAIIAFLRITPLGVTSEISNLSKNIAETFEVMPARLEGLDSLRGCIALIKNSFWSNNGLFITGLILGSFASSTFSQDFKIQIPKKNEVMNSFIGGIFMGFGAMIALGCTVGNLLSGIMTASLSGWVFLVFCALGLYLGWYFKSNFLQKGINH